MFQQPHMIPTTLENAVFHLLSQNTGIKTRVKDIREVKLPVVVQQGGKWKLSQKKKMIFCSVCISSFCSWSFWLSRRKDGEMPWAWEGMENVITQPQWPTAGLLLVPSGWANCVQMRKVSINIPKIVEFIMDKTLKAKQILKQKQKKTFLFLLLKLKCVAL